MTTPEHGWLSDNAGRIENISLAPNVKNALFPLFEAVMNSIQAIEERFGKDHLGEGRISVFVHKDTVGEYCGFTVTDNGIGFTADNLTSVRKFDSRKKAKLGGKGVGRLLWLKVADGAQITSVYETPAGRRRCSFSFTIADPIEAYREEPVNAEHLKEAGRANLRIMPDERIKEKLGISRQTAEQSFNKAIRKYEVGRPLKERESQILKVFGLSMMWQFALSDKIVWRDFVDLLVNEGSLAEEDTPRFEPISMFVSLYALNIMHGARLKMADGKIAQLRLAASEEGGFLRIKAEIPIRDKPKPVTTSVPLFETSLIAADHCDPKLLTAIDEPIPAEIDRVRLVALA